MTIPGSQTIVICAGRQDQELDVSGLPDFTAPDVPLTAAISRSAIDFGLLGIYILASFGFTFWAFLRYDMR